MTQGIAATSALNVLADVAEASAYGLFVQGQSAASLLATQAGAAAQTVILGLEGIATGMLPAGR
jgi:hypothetical protein